MTELGEYRALSFGEFVLVPCQERVIGPAGEVRIGRKAFRLLQALVARPGALLTKDLLFETVWDGTLVSESALTATVKELRRALGDEAKNPRFIESVYGRGYRFVAPVALTPAPAPDLVVANPAAAGAVGRRLSRRALFGWGFAAGCGVLAAGLAERALLDHQPSPEVAELVASARQLMDQNTRAGQNQAIGLLRRVTVLAPDFADGWGMLGIAYGIPTHFRERTESLSLRVRARAAGDRALELDPGNAYGELARAVELPFIGHWFERDQRLARALVDRPQNDDVLELVAFARSINGRSSAALPLYERIKQRPLTPGRYGEYIQALWCSGRLDDAERALDEAGALYPTQATIWFERFNFLLFGGRPEAAATLVSQAEGRPTGLDVTAVADLAAWAEAIAHPARAAARQTMARLVEQAHEDSISAENAIRVAGALGDRDTAFAVADAYYFSRGFVVPDSATPGSAASLDQRQTSLLFEPETASLRDDRRFERLVAEIGLAAYWQQAGVVPDYRARSSA